VGHVGTKKTLHPQDSVRRGNLVPGLSEPNHGSDLAAVETRAIDQGDHFIVNGSKVWTSNAHHADFTTLLCRTDPTLPKHKGLSYLLVDMKSPASRCTRWCR